MMRTFGIRTLIVASIFGSLFSSVRAAAGGNPEPEKIYLWDKSAPYALADQEKDKPFMQVFPAKPNRCAIIVCPGGGYGNLALDHEGTQVAQWLNSIGVSAFVLNYRHNGKGYQHPAPLSDAQRAIRLVRHNAKQWAIDPNQIGILGFSAGGHLASTAATHYRKSAYEQKDAADQVSCRPDFAVLVYPVITLEPPYHHGGSRRNLLGDNPSPEQIHEFSNQYHVDANTPPTLLVHADDDKGVPPQNSILYYEALKKANVPAEMHIFLKGGHGFGMKKGIGPAENWPDLCRQWMQASAILK